MLKQTHYGRYVVFCLRRPRTLRQQRQILDRFWRRTSGWFYLQQPPITFTSNYCWC